MTAKETAIKNAYISAGVDWEQVKEFIDDDGWIVKNRYNPFSEIMEIDRSGILDIEDVFEHSSYYGGNEKSVRPKSLSGIETNNGWITIESEKDLPGEKGDYFVYDAKDGQIDLFSGKLSNALHIVYGTPLYTHYQPIVKPKPPIY